MTPQNCHIPNQYENPLHDHKKIKILFIVISPCVINKSLSLQVDVDFLCRKEQLLFDLIF